MITKKSLLIILLIISFSKTTIGQSVANTNTLKQRMQWWEDARLGMFIHWGVFSELGGEWNGVDYGKEMGTASAEWIYLMSEIDTNDYKQAAQRFNPKNYSPEEWVKSAKDAGMKYIVLTTKHHDGFALFNTKASDWNILQASPYKKDLIKQYIDECHKQGIRVGLYYSHEKDWYHHVRLRNDTSPIKESYKKLVKTQIEELLTNYGQIDLIWFDMGISAHKEFNQMCYDLVRKLQPNCIISSRIGNGLGDYKNLGDRELVNPGMNEYVESIMTMRLNWGFDKNDKNWKSSSEVISMISKSACRGSNFLLNLGPQPDGKFTPEETIRLKHIGEWMTLNGDAIYETKGSPFKGEYKWGSLTSKKQHAFLHLFDMKEDHISVNGIISKVKKAYLLHNNQPIEFKQNLTDKKISLDISTITNSHATNIIALDLEGELKVDINEGPTWIPEPIKHLTRKEIVGIATNVSNFGFTISNKEDEIIFKLNENIEYRIVKNKEILSVQGFHVSNGEKYRVVYTPFDTPVIEIISKEN
ncbi:hypothetical protein APS56_04605 [Pseudalgibacter alginicilyticus]|uniref:alpha-L-fucosidase n=1 Tax=Pseudalgibacter alginicilyticus TaxID=1736674 RepID=A0A0P0D9J3_9FLAO|nr:alpha-L-fucosidase [Pseudalgibacter alginicilyticus]ALJ04463.1 hypothetical protein APS56_04605 [Pseudalgibacter alginicilyticus]